MLIPSCDSDAIQETAEAASARRRLDDAGSWKGSGSSGSRGGGEGVRRASAPNRASGAQTPGYSIRDDPRYVPLEDLFAAQGAEDQTPQMPVQLRGWPRPGTYAVPRFCGDYGFKQCLNCLRWLCSGSRKHVGWREWSGGYVQHWYRCPDWDMECEWTEGIYATDGVRRT